MVCVCFSLQSKGTNVFPKHILKSKARDQPIQTRKKLTPKLTFKKLEYCFLVEATKIENTSCPFKTKNRHPSWLHCTVVGLSEAATRGALYKKLFLKVLIYLEENTYVGVSF